MEIDVQGRLQKNPELKIADPSGSSTKLHTGENSNSLRFCAQFRNFA